MVRKKLALGYSKQYTFGSLYSPTLQFRDYHLLYALSKVATSLRLAPIFCPLQQLPWLYIFAYGFIGGVVHFVVVRYTEIRLREQHMRFLVSFCKCVSY